MTPAIHTAVYTSGSWSKSVYYTSTPTVYTGVSYQVGFDSEDRPASSSPGRNGNWRITGEWKHSGCHQRMPSATLEYLDGGVRTVVSGDIFGVNNSTAVRNREVSQNTSTASLTRALSNAKNQDINLLVTIAEFQQSIDMVAVALLRIARDVKGFRRRFPRWYEQVLKYQIGGNSMRRRDLWCKIPQAWLELQYGWKPAMADILAVVNRAYRSNRDRVPAVMAKGSYTERYTDSFQLTPYGWGSITDARVTAHFTERAVTRLWFAMKDLKLKSSGELGLLDPVSLIWEMLPYSFVVDWALPLGDWLNALGGPIGLDYIDGCTSATVEVEYGTITGMANGLFGKVVKRPSVKGGGSDRHFHRWPHHTLPYPGIYVKNPLTVGHAANALSLLSQAFTGRV